MQIIATPGFGKTSFAACYTNKGMDKTPDSDTCLIIPIKGETGADGLDAFHHRHVGLGDELARVLVHVADEERGGRIAMHTVAEEGDVDVDDVAVGQRSGVGDAVADDLVHRRADHC